ncbi:RING-H2 finger protein ATL74 [Brachypodium distachyon]|uniref:RING-type E3 ubiquitin transferase n=1 Tax=Brachypodium distachyon TaxID=15368 RepID=I1I5X9_BRADI|nr:RING-H2 finger protein ATL74 [Brachypodium distachyon]KQJ97699.1 hypothetical protein BRADI_3g32700v3 [Brachypodium distachyon]|eukprot:XP_010234979.1 RING-H2 finger protein ATL74 [Brachypodium distachyon]
MATASSHARRLAARNEVTTATPAVGPSQTTSGRGPAAQFDLSSGAATAVVFLSIVLCFILLCTYCRCARQRARAGRAAAGFPTAAFLLRPADAASLPVVPYAGATTKGQERDCPVCLEEFGDDDGVKVVPACGHVFHAACIDRWLGVRNSCPVCRCAVVCYCAAAGDGRDASVAAGAGDGDDDQEVVLERVVAMIEAIREEQAAARRAQGSAAAGGR